MIGGGEGSEILLKDEKMKGHQDEMQRKDEKMMTSNQNGRRFGVNITEESFII